ncbi:DUF397 domain-containing protein [Streptomyces axinellae]|uniref:DUF397 domain-containing protein n=1 Tax=Streptomyces axinellae TaxID=552788 RepID=UPI0031CE3EF3
MRAVVRRCQTRYPGGVPVRDSEDSRGPALIFETAAWSSFVGAVRGGEFPA